MKLNSGHGLSETSLLRASFAVVLVVVDFMVVPKRILMFILVMMEMVDEANEKNLEYGRR